MENKQLLQTLRHALSLSEPDMAGIFSLSGYAPGDAELTALLSDNATDDTADDADACPDIVLRAFLEGLILSERGPREDGTVVAIEDSPLSNNQILKKLRIAFNFQGEDMRSIFEEGGATLSSSEFGALFRRDKNKHFRLCSDELLQSFLAGLSPSLDQ